MFRRIQHVHFVGIGGIGMSGIAEVLVNLGFRVSGSDAKRSNVTDRLQHMGVDFAEGHEGENVGDAHVVVRSTAIRDDNPEIVEAQRRSIPVIPRAEMLAELMRLKPHTVAVAGSHGKTTTTSMVSTVLGHAGMDPTIVVGGVVGAFGSNAHLGTSDLMVVEADESDRSFLMLTPTIAVVTNIDREHMDYYHDMDDVRTCFTNFVNKVPFYGASVLVSGRSECAGDHSACGKTPHHLRTERPGRHFRAQHSLRSNVWIGVHHLAWCGCCWRHHLARAGLA